jgi:hypothetical protein
MLQVVYPVGIDNTPKSNDTILKRLIIEERRVGRFDNMRDFAKVVQSGSLAGAAASCYRCFDSVPGAVLLPDRDIKSAPRRTNRSSVGNRRIVPPWHPAIVRIRFMKREQQHPDRGGQ